MTNHFLEESQWGSGFENTFKQGGFRLNAEANEQVTTDLTASEECWIALAAVTAKAPAMQIPKVSGLC